MPKQTFFNLPVDKRERILDCAVDEFAGYGYDKASINRIVAAAGIAKGSFYQYFQDKEDIYGHVMELMIIRRKKSISDSTQHRLDDLNFTEFIRLLFITQTREFMDNPKLMQISYDYINHRFDPVQKRLFEKYKHLNDNFFQRFIDYEKSRGEIDALVDTDILSYMLIGMSERISNDIQERGAAFLTEEYISDMVDKMEYILTNGIYKNI